VAEPKVRVLDRHGHNIDIPDNLLPELVGLVRHSLIKAGELLDEVETLWWRTPTLHPTGERGETFHGRKEQYFLWFKEIFLKLHEIDPGLAKFETLHWPRDDQYHFGKLLIFAASFATLATSKEMAALIISLPDQIFWDPYCQRELLFTLRARWPELSVRQRQSIERKIILGPARWERRSEATIANARHPILHLDFDGLS
jgi:hypothetical protein